MEGRHLMPRTIFDKYANPLPPPDMLRDLFNHAQKARGLTAPELGGLLDKSPEYIRLKKHRGTDSFTVADVRQWCEALGINDPLALGKAILREGR